VIFVDPVDPGIIKAKNDITGKIDFSGTDPAAVLQSAIDALAKTGGTIVLAPGTYIWQSVPGLPKDLPNWLKIVGDGDVTIQLTANGPRAFDFRKPADYDTFRNIWIENLVIDCNNVGGQNHVIVGTYQNGRGLDRISIENIVIRNVKTINVPVDPVNTQPSGNPINHRLNVYLVTYHEAPGEKQTHIANVLIENCDFRGGNQGIVIGGSVSPSAPGVNVFIDQIRINNCRHSLLSVQTQLFHSANFHIGVLAFGGYVHITNCYGEYSGDVGVEINTMTYALVENVTIRDAASAAFYHRNHNNPQDPAAQRIIFKNCKALKLTLGSKVKGRAFLADDLFSIPLGTLMYDTCTFYTGVPRLDMYGEIIQIAPMSGIPAIIIRDFKAVVENVSYGGSEPRGIWPIFIWPRGSDANITIDGLHFYARGKCTGSCVFTYTVLRLAGSRYINFSDISIDVNIANMRNGNLRFMDIGDTPSTIEGTIRGVIFNQFAGDNAPQGILIRGISTLVIPSQIRIEDCDFSRLPPSASEILFTAGDENREKVYLYGNIWRGANS
jgi:hypothetical protein